MPSQPVRLPPKVFGVVEATTHVFPLARIWLQDVCIRGHARETQHRLSVGDVGSRDVVYGPVVLSQLHGSSLHPSPFQYAIYGLFAPICQPLNAHRLGLHTQPGYGLAVCRVQVLCCPYCRIFRHVQSSVKLWIFVCAMVEDVSQREVLLAAVGLRRDGWRWEDGELGCTAHGEERQQQGSCYARRRGAERSATHVVVTVQMRSRGVKWFAASEVQLHRWHASCINDDDGIHAAGACTCKVYAGTRRSFTTVHRRTGTGRVLSRQSLIWRGKERPLEAVAL